MSDLERAQEWLGCSEAQFYPWATGGLASPADKVRPTCGKHHAHQGVWPCPEATRLAALLAETRADEGRRIRDALLEGAEKDEARGLKEPAKAQRAVAAWMTRGLEDA